ncbi:MAG: hypothetical protein U5J83_11245 [Bryobacterales bacterium]|nr:hypothetical protein [Bryobacterales bacterium]
MPQNRFEIPHPSATALARILLIDGDATSRMTVKAVLEAGGYDVSSATTTVHAMELLDESSFELVLCHAKCTAPEIDPAVLSYARFQDYEPATALLHTVHCSSEVDDDGVVRPEILVEPQNIPDLLEHVADLIGSRALSLLDREFQPGGTIC